MFFSEETLVWITKVTIWLLQFREADQQQAICGRLLYIYGHQGLLLPETVENVRDVCFHAYDDENL